MQQNTRDVSGKFRRTTPVRALALCAAGVVAIAGGASTGCVSTGRYYQVEQERDALQARNDLLKAEVENANRNGESLSQEKNALQNRNSELESKLQSLENQGEVLGSQLEEQKKLQATYDGLIKNLQKELKSGQIEVTQLRDGLRVNVAQDILFDSGSAELDRNGTAVLGKVATELKKQTSHQILVTGHTDNKVVSASLSKKYPSNWELAGARAASVVRLFAQSGLSSKRMLAVSVADSQPVASNKSEEGRAKNRRIEIRLRPLTPDNKN
ncbi:MAG TPA: OmpA family protein [Candidatus Polarisedimenticolia bacterium]|nr:OmpA family protein [Candidatus Polarisedimenticolia bacterium]